MRLMSSAYVISLVEWWIGVGRSAVKKLNKNGERMAPCGTPFCNLIEWERLFLYNTFAKRLVMKLESHFLSFFSKGEWRIF